MRELTDLVSTRRKAIASVEIAAEHLVLVGSLLKRFDSEKLRRALADYSESERSAADRIRLYEVFCNRQIAQPFKQITLVQDGSRYSLSKQDDHRYVTDHRAIVRGTMPGSPEPRAEIHRLEGTVRPLDVRDFSQELKSPFLEWLTAGQVVADDKGQLLVAGKVESLYPWKMSISREDGILAESQLDMPHGCYMTMQAGRVATLADVPFPAVICEALFKGDSPGHLILLVPTTIKVNQAPPESAFTIAMPSGTKIVDNRHVGHEPRFADKDVEDIVDLADSLATKQAESKSSLK